jgi:hypothetical protein
MSIERRGAGLAVTHVTTLKDVLSILALVEEEVVGPLLYWDAEEVVERADVHRELLLQSCSGTLEKLWVRGGEYDVVNIEQRVSRVRAATVDEQRGVRLGLQEA